MPIKKKQKPHSSARKKASASNATSSPTKKAVSKASKATAKKKAKTKERPAWLKKRDELTLKMFQEVYEDYQQGKFHRIL